jgi:hypothetical protein
MVKADGDIYLVDWGLAKVYVNKMDGKPLCLKADSEDHTFYGTAAFGKCFLGNSFCFAFHLHLHVVEDKIACINLMNMLTTQLAKG